MNSHTTERFRRALAALPDDIRQQAREAYRLFRDNPQHPGLRFRQVHPTLPVYSARINADYRAVGIRTGETIVWFWVGKHSEYERLLRNLS
jgi:hypothetical protein